MRVVKGHGTENDFLLIADLDGRLDLTEELVRALCDRHAGIGADGVLRVVASAKDPASAHLAAQAPYFMDYRNADGSIAEMCGNGVRVFMRYLQSAGLAGSDAAIATRGGVKRVRSEADGAVTVALGRPKLLSTWPTVAVAGQPTRSAAASVEMPNPHVIVWVDSAAELAGLDLATPPRVTPPLPAGQNVEFGYRSGARRIVMRVHERGVGETRSCGTGICAVVVAAALAEAPGEPKSALLVGDGSRWQVDIPGGTCFVTWRPDGEIELTGPAVLVGEIEIDDTWLARLDGQLTTSDGAATSGSPGRPGLGWA